MTSAGAALPVGCETLLLWVSEKGARCQLVVGRNTFKKCVDTDTLISLGKGLKIIDLLHLRLLQHKIETSSI